MKQVTAVGFETDAQYEDACLLAKKLGLLVDNHVLPRLSVTLDKLVLLVANFSPLYVDFNPEIWKKRRNAGKKQGLVRACKPLKGMRIIDATAGWGRDAAVLSSFGAEVLMLERQPIMAALLEDGLRRMSQQSSAPAMSLLGADAIDYLSTLAPDNFPEVIYIDPMHPIRQKTALVKKDMQALQNIIGEDNDAARLIELATHRALQRVVVKWPQRLAPLLSPQASISGKTVRFDIYSSLY